MSSVVAVSPHKAPEQQHVERPPGDVEAVDSRSSIGSEQARLQVLDCRAGLVVFKQLVGFTVFRHFNWMLASCCG